jgi:hypothetical protein
MMASSWASTDLEEGRRWLKKVKALGTVVMDMVSETKRRYLLFTHPLHLRL